MNSARARMPPRRRRWLVPEVIQSSAMDCGPAVLKAFLGGFGIRLSYGRLREACRTDVDGTCVSTLDDIAALFGRPLDQHCFPRRDIGGPETKIFPCITMIKTPTGFSHFVILWRRIGPWVQVMDPARGRYWTRWASFQSEIHQIPEPVDVSEWLDFAGSDENIATWRWRADMIGLDHPRLQQLGARALEADDWRPVAALDAALRLVATLIERKAVGRGPAAGQLVGELAAASIDDDGSIVLTAIPWEFWPALPAEDGQGMEDGEIALFGGIYLRLPSAEEDRAWARESASPHTLDGSARARDATIESDTGLSPGLQAALVDDARWPLARMMGQIWRDGRLHLGIVLGALAAGAWMRVVEALVLRGLVDLQSPLGLGEQRLSAALVIVAALGLGAWVQMGVSRALWRIARGIEMRLRLDFWRKIPRLNDQYFQSRLRSDMAERAHGLHTIRDIPILSGEIVRAAAMIVVTLVAVAFVDGHTALALGAGTLLMAGLALWFTGLLTERTMRFQGLRGALSVYFLDALAGHVPIRSHGAHGPLARAQEAGRVAWERAGESLLKATVAQRACLQAVGSMGVAAILWPKISDPGDAGAMLLLAYWALELPNLAIILAGHLLAFPQLRTRIVRASEPLDALETPGVDDDADGDVSVLRERLGFTGERAGTRGVEISMEGLEVVAGGHQILSDIDVHIQAGEHIAIVGSSGAGKSTLVGILLGWYPTVAGRFRINGRDVDAPVLNALRRQTAWVDPSLQLWNRSVLHNLGYGCDPDQSLGVSQAIADAQLSAVLQRLDEGLQGVIGEDGSLLSGGEAQRVRLARALLRPDVELVVLDEAFRGLDRPARRSMLQAASRRWSGATLINVSHDIADTEGFDRVWVVEGGRVVEQGSPLELRSRPGSRYAELLARESELFEELWKDPRWRAVELQQGRLSFAEEQS